MLQCGFVRSNFSLAIGSYGRCFTRNGNLERVAGIETAYSAWKAAALPLSYTRRNSSLSRAPSVVGEVGLEPTKAYARVFTVPPLCRSGHSPSRSEPSQDRRTKGFRRGMRGAKERP